MSRRFETLVKKAGIVGATFHDRRRSFSTLAQRVWVEQHVVKDLGGWLSVKVVEKQYTGEIPTVMERVIKTLARAQGAAG